MTYTPLLPHTLRARIELPSSKSISNRALLLCALSGKASCVKRVSPCDDTKVMQQALEHRPETIDILAAGTAMRFLTAYFAATPGEEHVLTGTERMRQRPIGVLVDALRKLGADISYTEQEGYPPLRIRGRQLRGGRLQLHANVSSQYISALLMVAPLMTEGLTLELTDEIISRPYIDMTLALMRSFGAEARWTDGQTLQVPHGSYTDGTAYTVESDWSAASYWYELVALSTDTEARIELPWLFCRSLQGDQVVSKLFAPLGVRTEYLSDHEGVVLTKDAAGKLPEGVRYECSLVNCPDLAQTLVAACAFLRRPFRFTGLQSLRIKETDRMAALHNELAKFGITLGIEGDDTLFIENYPDGVPHYDGRPIATYHDHRMAMSMAPAALLCADLKFENPEVVSKSYPGFWNDLQSL